MTADFKQGTNLAGKVLASGLCSLSGDNTVYTVPTGSAVKIATAVLCNTAGGAVTVAVNVVPNGGTLGPGNLIVSGYSLAAGDSTSITELVGALLDAGTVISVNASAGNDIACTITGAVSS